MVGAGPGRGIELIIISVGLCYLLPDAAISLHPQVRWIEDELPDAANVV